MTVSLFSSRGRPLIWQGGQQPDIVVLTMECHSKWYELILVHADRIEAVHYGVLHDFCVGAEPAYCDHAPNPRAVQRLAAARGYHLDTLALEMMIGRWELEYLEDRSVYH